VAAGEGLELERLPAVMEEMVIGGLIFGAYGKKALDWPCRLG
jgi:hypothetical protein